MQALRYSVCVVAMISSIVLGFCWKFSMENFIPASYPRLELPVATNTRSDIDATGPIVSLSRGGKWFYEDGRSPDKKSLRAALDIDLARIHESGRHATIRVRIANDASAKHFLEINRIAVECGYEQMIVQCVRPRLSRRNF